MTSISLLNHPGIELQAIGGTAAEVEEAQRQAYLENPNDFFGPPPRLTPSPSLSSNMHLDAEDDMLIPPNSPPPLPHPLLQPSTAIIPGRQPSIRRPPTNPRLHPGGRRRTTILPHAPTFRHLPRGFRGLPRST